MRWDLDEASLTSSSSSLGTSSEPGSFRPPVATVALLTSSMQTTVSTSLSNSNSWSLIDCAKHGSRLIFGSNAKIWAFVLMQRNSYGFCLSRGAISSHEWPRVTRGWKWQRVRSKKTLNCLNQPVVVNNELFLICSFSLQWRKPCQNEKNGFYFWLGSIFTATGFGYSWLEMAPRERQNPFNFHPRWR